jgi:hypothetical protein
MSCARVYLCCKAILQGPHTEPSGALPGGGWD